MREVENFLSFLEYKLGNSKVTINNRKLSSLKSLFDYLQNKAETPDLKPYLQRNVMAKIELNLSGNLLHMIHMIMEKYSKPINESIISTNLIANVIQQLYL